MGGEKVSFGITKRCLSSAFQTHELDKRFTFALSVPSELTFTLATNLRYM